jgi:hypothetical protein
MITDGFEHKETARELEQRLEQLLSIDPDPAHMLVVMPQHDSDAHDFALREGSLGRKLHHGRRSRPAISLGVR